MVPGQTDLEAYFNDIGEMSKREKEAYSLLSYALVAGQLRPASVQEYQAMRDAQQLLDDSSEESEPVNSQGDDDRLERENERLRSKNKELVAMMSGALSGEKANSKQIHLLQHQIELQEKELSDLREAVYVLKNGSGSEPPVDESTRYPYLTSGKIISFGGHETWLKEMRRKLPNVIFVAPSSLPNTDLIRGADAVWLQTNCMSHADFFRIINIVRHNGVPLCVCQQKSYANGHEKVVQCQHGQVFLRGGTACRNAKDLVLRNAKNTISGEHSEKMRGEVLNFWCSF